MVQHYLSVCFLELLSIIFIRLIMYVVNPAPFFPGRNVLSNEGISPEIRKLLYYRITSHRYRLASVIRLMVALKKYKNSCYRILGQFPRIHRLKETFAGVSKS